MSSIYTRDACRYRCIFLYISRIRRSMRMMIFADYFLLTTILRPLFTMICCQFTLCRAPRPHAGLGFRRAPPPLADAVLFEYQRRHVALSFFTMLECPLSFPLRRARWNASRLKCLRPSRLSYQNAMNFGTVFMASLRLLVYYYYTPINISRLSLLKWYLAF